MYLSLPDGGSVDLRAPADMTITRLTYTKDTFTDTGDHGITLALCEDVYIYFLHVKTLVPELAAVFAEADCPETEGYQHCWMGTRYEVEAGTLLGQVGSETHRNFDFGAYDYRTRLGYVNPSRYGHPEVLRTGRVKSWSVTCPLDLYDEPTKADLYDRVERVAGPRCGRVMQDVPGTLQGNWFNDATTFSDNSVSFVYDNNDPAVPVISVAGIVTGPGFWKFEPEESGRVNRRFGDVTADGSAYCYHHLEGANYGVSALPGRILVQLVGETGLVIEHQTGSCDGVYEFNSPINYNR